MVECVESRFAAACALHSVQSLTDNGSAYGTTMGAGESVGGSVS